MYFSQDTTAFDQNNSEQTLSASGLFNEEHTMKGSFSHLQRSMSATQQETQAFSMKNTLPVIDEQPTQQQKVHSECDAEQTHNEEVIQENQDACDYFREETDYSEPLVEPKVVSNPFQIDSNVSADKDNAIASSLFTND